MNGSYAFSVFLRRANLSKILNDGMTIPNVVTSIGSTVPLRLSNCIYLWTTSANKVIFYFPSGAILCAHSFVRCENVKSTKKKSTQEVRNVCAINFLDLSTKFVKCVHVQWKYHAPIGESLGTAFFCFCRFLWFIEIIEERKNVNVASEKKMEWSNQCW